MRPVLKYLAGMEQRRATLVGVFYRERAWLVLHPMGGASQIKGVGVSARGVTEVGLILIGWW